MNKNKLARAALAALVWITLTGITPAPAQSVDALLEKLVEKGILSAKEAGDLRAESDKGFTKAYAAKTGMPDWVSALKFNGDFRGRYEGFFGENPAFVQRNRFRYRLRFGVTAELLDDLEVGFRLSSSERVGEFGGDPISGNTSFSDNGSKKFVFIDLAYAKWSPWHTAPWAGAVTVGKMENPFASPSTMMFDRDYTPEGIAAQIAYSFNDHHQLKFNAAGFILDELAASSRDPWLAGAQLRWDGKWSTNFSTTLGVAGFLISNRENLSNANVPNSNRGNTRNASGAPQFGFNPVYVDGGITWTLDEFPLYPGAFPIRLTGDYVNNPAAPRDNQGYSVGFAFGKAGRKGAWELAYRWEELRGDAWFEEFPESDFGAYYQAQQANAGFNSASNPTGAGYGAGTNVRGHAVKLSYSPYNSFTLGVTCFVTDLIRPSPAGSTSGMTRLQVDGVLKF